VNEKDATRVSQFNIHPFNGFFNLKTIPFKKKEHLSGGTGEPGRHGGLFTSIHAS